MQRRKEHINFATNFAEARGFVRTNWKSKNFDPLCDPTVLDSSTDESEYGDEQADKVGLNPDEVSEHSQEDLNNSQLEECESPTKFSVSRRDSITKLKKAMSVRGGNHPAETIDLS